MNSVESRVVERVLVSPSVFPCAHRSVDRWAVRRNLRINDIYGLHPNLTESGLLYRHHPSTGVAERPRRLGQHGAHKELDSQNLSENEGSEVRDTEATEGG